MKEIKVLIEKYNTIKSKDLIQTYDEANTYENCIYYSYEKSNKWYSLKSDIEKTDNNIDEIFYKLYGITEKEKKIIEGEKS